MTVEDSTRILQPKVREVLRAAVNRASATNQDETFLVQAIVGRARQHPFRIPTSRGSKLFVTHVTDRDQPKP